MKEKMGGGGADKNVGGGTAKKWNAQFYFQQLPPYFSHFLFRSDAAGFRAKIM